MRVLEIIKRYPPRSSTLLFLCFAATCVLLASAAARAGNDNAPPLIINPTGRTLEMTVPLHYRSFYLGDLAVRLTPEQEVELPLADLNRTVEPLLRPETLTALGKAAAGQDYVALSTLKANGFDFRFDPGAVSILFTPTLDQKVEGNVSIHARRAQTDSPNAADPAEFSAFLNLRSAVDYVSMSPSGDEGLRAPRLDLEGAARWQGLVVEAEGTFEPDDASIFGETGEGFKRRGTRIIRDFEDDAIRATAGDVYPVGTSFQHTPDLLGLSLERSYSKLQPGKNIRSTGRRSFRLERPSSVDVQVNGITIRRLKLDPGDYKLSDLPITTGLNDVTLQIEDDVGKAETLEFSIFLDNELLMPGLSEWTFAAGVPSRFDDGEPDYSSSDVFLTGYYRRGLLESLTGEAHLQGTTESMMGGLGILLGSSFGLFSLEGAASMDATSAWGAAFEGQYALANIEDGTGRRHSLRLSAKAVSPEFTAAIPETGSDLDKYDKAYGEWLNLSASYGTELPFHISASVSAGYGFGQEEDHNSHHADLSLSRSFGSNLSMGMTGGYYARYDREDELSLLLRLQYRPSRNASISALHDARSGRSSIGYTQRSGRGIGSWQTSIDLTHETADDYAFDTDRDDFSVNGEVSYTGNRAVVSAFQDSRFVGLEAQDIDQRTSIRVETALAFADGHVAVGRPVSNGFAIVAPHAGLSDNQIYIGKETSGVTAQTDFLGPALLPGISPYTLNRIDYAVDDLPPGYDLGDGLFDLAPKHKSGYALKVGSAYTVTALGTLIDPEGDPVALITGVATEEAHPEKKVELFTNRTGRFAAQGLAPGKWAIEMATQPVTRFAIEIPDGTVGLFRAGEIHAIQ